MKFKKLSLRKSQFQEGFSLRWKLSKEKLDPSYAQHPRWLVARKAYLVHKSKPEWPLLEARSLYANIRWSTLYAGRHLDRDVASWKFTARNVPRLPIWPLIYFSKQKILLNIFEHYSYFVNLYMCDKFFSKQKHTLFKMQFVKNFTY